MLKIVSHNVVYERHLAREHWAFRSKKSIARWSTRLSIRRLQIGTRNDQNNPEPAARSLALRPPVRLNSLNQTDAGISVLAGATLFHFVAFRESCPELRKSERRRGSSGMRLNSRRHVGIVLIATLRSAPPAMSPCSEPIARIDDVIPDNRVSQINGPRDLGMRCGRLGTGIKVRWNDLAWVRKILNSRLSTRRLQQRD